jgi:hypothetical protein
LVAMTPIRVPAPPEPRRTWPRPASARAPRPIGGAPRSLGSEAPGCLESPSGMIPHSSVDSRECGPSEGSLFCTILRHTH